MKTISFEMNISQLYAGSEIDNEEDLLSEFMENEGLPQDEFMIESPVRFYRGADLIVVLNFSVPDDVVASVFEAKYRADFIAEFIDCENGYSGGA